MLDDLFWEWLEDEGKYFDNDEIENIHRKNGLCLLAWDEFCEYVREWKRKQIIKYVNSQLEAQIKIRLRNKIDNS